MARYDVGRWCSWDFAHLEADKLRILSIKILPVASDERNEEIVLLPYRLGLPEVGFGIYGDGEAGYCE